jgi:hypothetical protein
MLEEKKRQHINEVVGEDEKKFDIAHVEV